MSSYLFSPKAKNDVMAIWKYIATDNIKEADNLKEDIYKACEFLAEYPKAGSRKFEVSTNDIKFWVVRRNYLIVYDAESKPLRIIRVLHAARNVPNLLDSF